MLEITLQFMRLLFQAANKNELDIFISYDYHISTQALILILMKSENLFYFQACKMCQTNFHLATLCRLHERSKHKKMTYTELRNKMLKHLRISKYVQVTQTNIGTKSYASTFRSRQSYSFYTTWKRQFFKKCGISVKCAKCKLVFKDVFTRQKHLLRKHNCGLVVRKRSLMKCGKCGRQFKFLGNMKRHLETIDHSKVRER